MICERQLKINLIAYLILFFYPFWRKILLPLFVENFPVFQRFYRTENKNKKTFSN
jgi:hypothetical protein